MQPEVLRLIGHSGVSDVTNLPAHGSFSPISNPRDLVRDERIYVTSSIVLACCISVEHPTISLFIPYFSVKAAQGVETYLHPF